MTACETPDQTPLLYVPVTREELEAVLNALQGADFPYLLEGEELKAVHRVEQRAVCLLKATI